MSLLLLLPMALAAPTERWEPGPQAPTEQTCSVAPPSGYVVATGWGSGSKAKALLEAQNIARNRLVAQLCEGKTPTRCDAIRPHVRDWQPTHYEKGTACALAAVANTMVDTIATDAAKLEGELAALASAIERGAKGRPVRIVEDARTSVGDVLRGGLINALAGTSVSLAGLASQNAVDVRLSVATTDAWLTVSLQLQGPDGGIALGGFRLPADLLGTPVSAADAPSELRVEVQAERLDGVVLRTGSVVTQGDAFKLSARVSQPSFLYVIYQNSAGEEVIVTSEGVWAKPGRDVELPKAGFHFTVDDNAGRVELVHVIATPEPLPADLTQGVASSYRRLRGLDMVADSGPSSPTKAWYGDPSPVATGFGGAIYTLRLDHR